MTDASDAPIYPRYCFHLAPTVNTWSLFHVAEIHRLEQHAGFEGENFYFYKSLPIKWVRIVGVIVAIDEYSGRRIYTIDDSSGACIECMVTIPTPQTETNGLADTGRKADQQSENSKPLPVPRLYVDLDVGSVVDVKGGLSTFRDEKQITIERMIPLRCTAQEVALWEKRACFRKDVLDKPWVLRNREIRRCRKEAERSEEEAARKRKRLKAMIEGQMAKRPEKVTRDPPQEVGRDDSDKGMRNKRKVDLRQIIQNGAKGKYDALGL